jgi:[acyl-carrier-protein] S-malonyltransferase
MSKRIAFLFPGQGAQYPGMGKAFVETFPLARQLFEEADDLLKRKISDIILHGPEGVLTETKNSQTGIYITSMAMLKVLESHFPSLKPVVCAGLSLGEYTAVTASGRLSFEAGLPLVQYRGQFMNEACEKHKGGMAVILGLDAKSVEALVKEVNLPNDLWAANFNCPGQIVISGTAQGLEKGTEAALAKGAKRVLPLHVHGAFHSGLMKEAEQRLADYVMQVPLSESSVKLVMNVTGDSVVSLEQIRLNLIKQVTSPVRWEQGIRTIDVDLFVEVGCGKTLSGFNKRIGVTAPTISIEQPSDLDLLHKALAS